MRSSTRGGSWNNNSEYARCAYRNRNHPNNRNNNLGFRVVFSIASRLYPADRLFHGAPAAMQSISQPVLVPDRDRVTGRSNTKAHPASCVARCGVIYWGQNEANCRRDYYSGHSSNLGISRTMASRNESFPWLRKRIFLDALDKLKGLLVALIAVVLWFFVKRKHPKHQVDIPNPSNQCKRSANPLLHRTTSHL